MFTDLVQNEMVALLNQMYAEMGVDNPMSLEQLAAANPSLYAQIRAKAEESARAVLAQRQRGASPQQQPLRAPAAAARAPASYPPVASPQGMYAGHAQPDVTGRKRPGEFPHAGRQTGGYPPVAQAPQQHQHQVPYAERPIARYASRFNAPAAAPAGRARDFVDDLSPEQQAALEAAAA
jgi:hypothetical protein